MDDRYFLGRGGNLSEQEVIQGQLVQWFFFFDFVDVFCVAPSMSDILYSLWFCSHTSDGGVYSLQDSLCLDGEPQPRVYPNK